MRLCVSLFALLLLITNGCQSTMIEPVSSMTTPSSFSRSSAVIKLGDGSEVKIVTVSNGEITTSFIPALGGKITSLKDKKDREYISRSTRAYRKRTFGMKFSDTEFDGIDELFPTLGPCKYPLAPWRNAELPGHGELFQQAWELKGDMLFSMTAKGKALPYTFTRSMRLNGDTLELRYHVTNTSDSDIHAFYAFHPLFAGETGCKLDLPDDMPVTLSWSNKGWLGKRGTTMKIGEIKDTDGIRLQDRMFTTDSKRYWKIFTPKPDKGEVSLSYNDGSRLTMSWPTELFPHLAVWCSEGGVDGLHHIAPEPTTSIEEAMAAAHAKGKTLKIPANGTISWQIKLTVKPSAK